MRMQRYPIKVTILNQGKVLEHDVNLALPHEMFAALYKFKRSLWEQMFVNGGENSKCWQWCESD